MHAEKQLFGTMCLTPRKHSGPHLRCCSALCASSLGGPRDHRRPSPPMSKLGLAAKSVAAASRRHGVGGASCKLVRFVQPKVGVHQ
jgi:hypothetical protein